MHLLITQFLLKLQCRCLICASIIDLISSELHNLHKLSLDNITSLVKNKLQVAGICPDTVDTLLFSLHQEDAFHYAFNAENGLLRSKHKRTLVLLCNENHCGDFSHDKLFDALTQDLKHLEDNGVTINNKKWNVHLIALLCDNLGSH